MMGKLLIAGNGKGNPEITRTWVVMAVFIVVVSVVCFGTAVHLWNEASGVRDTIRETRKMVETDAAAMAANQEIEKERIADAKLLDKEAVGWLAGGAFILVSVLIYPILTLRSIKKTEIQVYEEMVTGKGYDRPGGLRVVEFQIAYDQISSVEITKNAVTVRAVGQGKSYKCCVLNPAQIRDVILTRIPKQ
ncbi:MAG: hypothetical protein FWE88_01140 [Phycisphaerae bacterium]|nr:hypothetical protein [Phycisphaerae bacterium]